MYCSYVTFVQYSVCFGQRLPISFEQNLFTSHMDFSGEIKVQKTQSCAD